METTLYAYQMSPGKDDLLWFTTSPEDCERAAREQREDMRRELSEGGVIGAMAVYRFVFRGLQPFELALVLNGEWSIADIAVVDRTLVAVVAE